MKLFNILKKIFISFNLILFTQSFLFSAHSNPIYGKNGMIVSTSEEASLVGIDILKKGGNAIDAAVAVGFALAVTSSGNGNLGGGGFLVASMASGNNFTIDHRETAPAKSYQTMFLNAENNVVPGMSLQTHASSGVPGTVDGLLKAFYDYGSGNISLRQILTPAIKLAERGFNLTLYEANRFNNYKEMFQKK